MAAPAAGSLPLEDPAATPAPAASEPSRDEAARTHRLAVRSPPSHHAPPVR